jgi:hypothetical protein
LLVCQLRGSPSKLYYIRYADLGLRNYRIINTEYGVPCVLILIIFNLLEEVCNAYFHESAHYCSCGLFDMFQTAPYSPGWRIVLTHASASGMPNMRLHYCMSLLKHRCLSHSPDLLIYSTIYAQHYHQRTYLKLLALFVLYGKRTRFLTGLSLNM